MRRFPIVIAATLAGTAAVLGFHPRRASVPVTTKTATAASPAPSSSATKQSSTSGTKTADGDPMSIKYGITQVRVTVSNGKITKVEAIQLPDSDGKSVAISSTAEPILAQSVLTKQTAAIDVVSGATYTSDSYAASLQSALDKVGFKAPDGSQASTDVSQLQ